MHGHAVSERDGDVSEKSGIDEAVCRYVAPSIGRGRLALVGVGCRLRPYHVESTGSRPITEVKQRRARLVLGWVTAWEYRVP